MSELLFGTAGILHSTLPPKATVGGIKRLAELGLGATEVEFVQGVRMNEPGHLSKCKSQ